MKQKLLDRAVARATGESVRHIQKMGFVLLTITAQGAEDAAEGAGSARPAHAQTGDQDGPTPAA
jgi:hypothetical protein